jgi:hypothetical protein
MPPFKTTPHHYVQLISICGLNKNRIVSLAFVVINGGQVCQFRQIVAAIKKRYCCLQITHCYQATSSVILTHAAETEFVNQDSFIYYYRSNRK